LNDLVLRAKLAKGMGHNYYGELAWPNDLLYYKNYLYLLESCSEMFPYGQNQKGWIGLINKN